uniref:TraT complement resistance protein n=1 Tax=Magnetococcus massalia (strain MO-1) TaxID=451514 RepID=A0A1S7LKN9_MAGMO|nr:exported protein of unknown function [Candidatus Magnetococcus massalia]
MRWQKLVLMMAALLFLAGCNTHRVSERHVAMVKNPQTGISYGSLIGHYDYLIEPGDIENRLMVRIRNTSGDVAFNLHQFRSSIEAAYRSRGFEIVASRPYNYLVDINLDFSGQYTHRNRGRYEKLGLFGGAAMGYQTASSSRSTTEQESAIILGGVMGVGLARLIEGMDPEQIYIIESRFSMYEVEEPDEDARILYFGKKKKTKKRQKKKLKRITKRPIPVVVYAGGVNVEQAQVAGEVRQRLVRIYREIL